MKSDTNRTGQNGARRIEADHFKHYKYPTKMEISENGALAYTAASVDIEENKYPVNLYVRSAGDRWQAETAALENARVTGFFWRGETLIVNALRDKEDQEKSEKGVPLSVIFAFDPLDGTARELFRLNKNVGYLAPLGETGWLLLCRDDLRMDALWDACGGDEERFLKQKEQEDNYIIADEYPFHMDDDGHVNKIRNRLYLYEDGALRRVSGEHLTVGKIKDFDGEYAVFSGAEQTGFLNWEEKLYQIDLKTFEISILDDKWQLYTDLRALKDAVIAVRSDKALYGESQNEYIDRISLSDRTVTRLNGDCETHVHNSLYTHFTYGMACDSYVPADGGVYFIATIRDRTYICFGDFASGEIRPVTDGELVIGDFRLCKDRFLMLAMERFEGPEIYVTPIDECNKNERITRLNDGVRGAFSVSEPEKFTFRSKDGKAEVYGYVMKPAGFQEHEKYPAVLFIHGGPNMAYSDCFYHDTQLLADRGYGVLYCNPRGSIGHGGEFMDLRLKYYTVDYDDILQFLDEAIARHDWVDADRLGVIGGSYGGMMTNWMITHNDRCKAAVSDRGVAFEMQDFFMSDCGFAYAEEVYGQTAWSEGGAADLWEKSSVKYAPTVKTPTLFLHAENDYRCTKEQAVIMFSALKFFGVSSRMVIVKDENHSYGFSGKPKNRILRFAEILNWFEKHL